DHAARLTEVLLRDLDLVVEHGQPLGSVGRIGLRLVELAIAAPRCLLLLEAIDRRQLLVVAAAHVGALIRERCEVLLLRLRRLLRLRDRNRRDGSRRLGRLRPGGGRHHRQDARQQETPQHALYDSSRYATSNYAASLTSPERLPPDRESLAALPLRFS